jgi:hypothetical protein
MKQSNDRQLSPNLENSAIRELTLLEAEQVTGGNPAGAAVGAIAGGAGYLGGAVISGEFTWSGFGASMAVGGLSGATMGVTAFGAYMVPRISFFGGAAVAGADGS